MSGILNKKKRLIDFIVTGHGKKKLSENKFLPSFISLTDRHGFYDKKELSIKHVSDEDKFYLETNNISSNDVIVHEFDDSGNLIIPEISGSSVIDGSLYSITTKTREISSNFASNNAILSGTINRFKKNKFIKTSEYHDNVNSTFEFNKYNHAFTLSNSVPFPKGPVTEAINIDNAEPLMFDDKLAHFKNFQYLPPVNKDNSNVGAYQDLRGTSRKNFKNIKEGLRIKSLNNDNDFLSQPDTVSNTVSINANEQIAVINRAPLKNLNTKISKEHTSINFLKTSFNNNLLLQVYEKNKNFKLTKLDIVDAGEFIDTDDSLRQRKHVYYVGKIFKDNNGFNTFVNIFTLIWD